MAFKAREPAVWIRKIMQQLFQPQKTILSSTTMLRKSLLGNLRIFIEQHGERMKNSPIIESLAVKSPLNPFLLTVFPSKKRRDC
jgi:hypothetical protein